MWPNDLAALIIAMLDSPSEQTQGLIVLAVLFAYFLLIVAGSALSVGIAKKVGWLK